MSPSSGRSIAGLVSALLLSACAQVQPTVAADYIGALRCVKCHAAQYDGWQKTRHASAMASLERESQSESTSCLPCHVTGYDAPMGYLDMNATPELAGVQCESCHGPASAHLKNPEQVRTMVPRPGVDSCRKCHTPEQDSAFDYENMSKKVH
ncbi:MAG: cytochrome c family protein [Nitrospirota bacterium]|nr:cytochrome c family protein [Nitrospirota bacterium]